MRVYFSDISDKRDGARGAVVEEKDGGFETPCGFFKLPLSRVLDVLCDVGYEEVFVAGDGSEEVEKLKTRVKEEWMEWETPRSIIQKLKRQENSKFCGAIALFVGFVKRINGDRKVIYLEYEKHEELYDKKLKELKEKILSYPGVEGVEIFHRTGRVFAGEDIVYVAVMGRSRKDVWQALNDAVEGMKSQLPIWKKEVFEGGEVWV